jgi:hypothetical protein
MRVGMLALILAFAFTCVAACGAARPSRWEPRLPREGPETVCECDGVVRQPKPSEASTPSDPIVVLAMCDGRVHDCREVRGGECGRYSRNCLD